MATAVSSSPKKTRFRSLLRDTSRIIFPELCCHCGNILVGDEDHLCTNCLCSIPWAKQAAYTGNITEQRLIGHIPGAAASLLFFNNGNIAQTIVHQIKYHGNMKMAKTYGRLLGKMLQESGRFDDIDLIIPVPLHFLRRIRRGYNQSELLCQAVSEELHRPIATRNLYRKRYTSTQTHKSRKERQENMKNVFAVRNSKQLENKHILLIDDVITTGATMEGCYLALSHIPGLSISVASLAITQKI